MNSAARLFSEVRFDMPNCDNTRISSVVHRTLTMSHQQATVCAEGGAPPCALSRQNAEKPRARVLVAAGGGGVKIDARELASALESHYTVAIVEVDKKVSPLNVVDIQVFIEHVIAPPSGVRDGEAWFKPLPAKRSYLLVNHEFIRDWDAKAIKSGAVTALCKTQIGLSILRTQGIIGKFIGFSSPPVAPLAAAKYHRALAIHLAGSSPLKNTKLVIEAWRRAKTQNSTLLITRRDAGGGPREHKKAADLAYWYSLKPVRANLKLRHIGEIVAQCVDNIYLCEDVLPQATVDALIAAAGVHLAPSATEGFGHIVNQGRAAGGVVVTLDVPPMNELINNLCGVVVPARMGAPSRKLLGSYAKYIEFDVPTWIADVRDLANGIERALSAAKSDELGAAAHARYSLDRSFFAAALRRAVAENND